MSAAGKNHSTTRFPLKSESLTLFIVGIVSVKVNPRRRQLQEQQKRQAFLRDVRGTQAFLLQLRKELDKPRRR